MRSASRTPYRPGGGPKRSAAPAKVGRDAAQVRAMFDRIAPGYDRLDRAMSLGLDLAWRARMARESGLPGGGALADLCCGTGDVVLAFCRRHPGCRGVALDASAGMLRAARVKLAGLPFRVRRGDALATGLPAGRFDAVTMAFGLRNLMDPVAGIREMRRLAAPGGRVLVLEFTRAQAWWMRLAYAPYLRLGIPLWGRLLSRDPAAYRYLRDTINAFHTPTEVLAMMRGAGLRDVRAVPLTGGVATLFIGDAPRTIRRRNA